MGPPLVVEIDKCVSFVVYGIHFGINRKIYLHSHILPYSECTVIKLLIPGVSSLFLLLFLDLSQNQPFILSSLW